MPTNYSTSPISHSKWALVGVLVVICGHLLTLKPGEGLSIQEIGLFCALIFIVLQWLSRYAILKTPISLRPLDIPIILLFFFFAFDFLKILFSDLKFSDWLHWRRFVFVLIYFPISRIRDIKHFNIIVITTTVISLIIAIWQLIQIISMGSISDLYIIPEIQSSYVWWSTLFMIGISRFIFMKELSIHSFIKLTFIAISIIFFIRVFSSAARTPLIIVSVCILVSCFFNIKHYKRLNIGVTVIVISLMCGVIYYFGLYTPYKTRLSKVNLEQSYEARATRYVSAWQIYRDSPLIGDEDPAPFRYYSNWYKEYRVGSPHSLFLYFLAYGGSIGFLCLMYFIFAVLRFYKHALTANIPNRLTMYLEGSFVAILGMLVTGFSSTVLIQVESWLYLGILLGLSSAIYYGAFGNTTVAKPI